MTEFPLRTWWVKWKKGPKRRRLKPTVAGRLMARRRVSLLGFAATTFPFRAPTGMTAAGNVEKGGEKNPKRPHNMRSLTKAEFRRRTNSKLSLRKSSLGDFVWGYLRASQLSGCYLGVTLPSWRISSRSLRRLCRVWLPLLRSFSLLSVCSSSSLLAPEPQKNEWLRPPPVTQPTAGMGGPGWPPSSLPHRNHWLTGLCDYQIQ